MKHIPDMEEPQLYREHDFCDSDFVELRTNQVFEVQMQYPLLGMKNAETQCFVRKEVYEMLLMAKDYLPEGIQFKILDGWRPLSLQKELYQVYSERILDKFGMENASEEEKRKLISNFVSEPGGNPDFPPVHTTGGAVDLTLVDENGDELDMGTAFDAFSASAYTAFFEDGSNIQVRDNRRILYHAMTKAGFTNLPSEWWHYDYGDRFWANYCHKPAIYRGVFTKEEMDEKGWQGQNKEGAAKEDK